MNRLFDLTHMLQRSTRFPLFPGEQWKSTHPVSAQGNADLDQAAPRAELCRTAVERHVVLVVLQSIACPSPRFHSA